MKKSAEYTLLKENLDGVLRKQEEMKSEIDVLTDSKRHLGTEKRMSIFELYSKVEAMFLLMDNWRSYSITGGIRLKGIQADSIRFIVLQLNTLMWKNVTTSVNLPVDSPSLMPCA
jgi:hypothetical protein